MGSDTVSGDTVYGYNTFGTAFGSVSPRTFVRDTATTAVTYLAYNSGTNGTLRFVITYSAGTVPSDGLLGSGPLTLTVGSATFAIPSPGTGNDLSFEFDPGGLSWSSGDTVSVSLSIDPPTNNAPVFEYSLNFRFIPENTAAGQSVGSPVTATDADTGDTLTYSLGGTDAASFDIVSTTGQIQTKAALNFESKASYSVTVTATDSSSATALARVTISVADADEQPDTPAAPSVSPTSGSTTSLDVSWTAPGLNGGPPITRYDLQYRKGTTGPFTNGPQDVTGTSSPITGLDADSSYQVQVRAENGETPSDWSPSGTGSTSAADGAQLPQVTITGPASVQEGDGLVVTVHRTGATAVGLIGAVIFVDTAGGDFEARSAFRIPPDSATGTAVEFTVQNDGVPADDRTITASVAPAYTTYEPGNPSSVTVMVTDADDPEPPTAPRNLTTMAGNALVTLAWTKGDDGGSTITKHQIQQKEGSAAYGDWMDIPDSAAGQKNQASHIVTGLTNSTDYAFQVRAVNDVGESDASVEATATPMAVSPLTVSVTITAAEIVVDEGRNAEFTLLRSGSATGALEVELTVIESGDMLHSPVPQRVTFPAGAARVTLTVQTVNDGGDERDSVVTVTVGQGTGYEPVPANAFASMTVRDNDRTPTRPRGPKTPGPRTSVSDAPTNLTAVGGDGQVVLTWEAPASDGGAEITDYEYRINGRNPWISIGSTNTTHTVTGLVNGTEYTFEVRAVNRIGKGRVPNQAEVTPEAPEVFTLDFAHFANGTSITSDLVFVNLSTQPARPAIYFYGTEGAPVSAESVVDLTGDLEITEDGALSIWTEMEPLGELTISTHGRGDLVTGSVKVVSYGPLGGFLRYTVPWFGVAGVGANTPVRDVLFPVRRREGGITTGVAIHNLGAGALGVTCRLMSGGVVLEEVEIPLEANGQTSWLIDAAFPAADTSDFLGSVRCDAVGRERFSAVALEIAPGTRTFTTLPVVEVSRGRGGETTLDFARFANGDGITSDLVFVNVGTTEIRPAIYFYDTEGEPMAAESVVEVTGDLAITEDGALSIWTEMEPLGELTISTHGRGSLVSGSVKVVSDGPLGGFLRYTVPRIGVAGVGASPPVSDAIFPVRRQEGGITTEVAIHNLESSPGWVRCDLMREGVLLDDVSIPLEANGQTSWFIEQAFPAADTSDFAGSVRCNEVGEGRFSAVALEMDPTTRTFITLPVFPVPEMPDRE